MASRGEPEARSRPATGPPWLGRRTIALADPARWAAVLAAKDASRAGGSRWVLRSRDLLTPRPYASMISPRRCEAPITVARLRVAARNDENLLALLPKYAPSCLRQGEIPE